MSQFVFYKFRVSPFQGLSSHKEFHVLSLLSPFKSTINCRLNSHLQVPNPNLKNSNFTIVSPLYSIYRVSSYYIFPLCQYIFPWSLLHPIVFRLYPLYTPIARRSFHEAGRSCLQSPWCIPSYRVPRGTNVARMCQFVPWEMWGLMADAAENTLWKYMEMPYWSILFYVLLPINFHLVGLNIYTLC